MATLGKSADQVNLFSAAKMDITPKFSSGKCGKHDKAAPTPFYCSLFNVVLIHSFNLLPISYLRFGSTIMIQYLPLSSSSFCAFSFISVTPLFSFRLRKRLKIQISYHHHHIISYHFYPAVTVIRLSKFEILTFVI